MPSNPAAESPHRSQRFLHSVLWSWFGVAVSIFSGILLAPYIVHKLGDLGSGVWVLIFSLVDNLGMIDLGFRSATLKYTAHYRATGELDKVNETLNTGLFFSGIVCLLAICATFLFAAAITRFEKISPEYARTFTILLIIVGISWASGAVFNLFSACLEGFQRFDLTSRIWIAQVAIRSIGIAAVLATGHGIFAMGMVVIAAMASTYVLNVVCVRRVFPRFRLSPAYLSYNMFRQMLGYGVHTIGAALSLQALNQTAPLLIAHFLPSTAFVNYYKQPLNLLQYSVDMVGRVGFVTGSHSAELAAKKNYEAIARMGVFINRYCLVLFAPLGMALIVYGPELFRAYFNPTFARMDTPLFPVMAAGVTLGTAAQFNSSSILYGLGKHQGLAYSLMVEAALCVAGLSWAIPHYGIAGAAWVASTLMLLNRGLVTSWLFCRAIHYNLWSYLSGIYVLPLTVAIPVLLAWFWVKRYWIPGRNLLQVLGGGALLAMTYYSIAYFVCVRKEHRVLPLNWLRARLRMAS